MRYESAINLKASLLGGSMSSAIASSSALPSAAVAATATARAATRPRFPFAIGVTGKGSAYRLAVRVQTAHPGVEQALELVRKRARGEVDVQVVGRVVKQVPWHQKRNRPLRIGGSVAHHAITAGTLGCFVTDRAGGDPLILSNNHVLADENNGSSGDTIVQPGPADGGRRSTDKIGELDRFVRLRRSGNVVDAATATLRPDMEYYYNFLEDIGEISGIRETPLEENEVVYKVGRTTGVTKGRISAFDIDELLVEYDMGDIEFNGQIQIRPDGNKPFSLGGDSGSLIVDRYRRAVALLFAGNDVDSTFANPISVVLDTLRVDLMHE